MKPSEIYEITLGGNTDKYIVTGAYFNQSVELRRVQVPKSKIDGVRLPISIRISYYGEAVKNTKRKPLKT